MSMSSSKYYSREEALERLRKYCSYRDRSHKEVWEKLKELNQDQETGSELISRLMEEKFLDEERFARAYVRGKFNNNHWGKQKIIEGLKEKGIHPTLRNMALEEIDEEAYQQKLQDLFEQKLKFIKAKNQWDKKAKVARYLTGKGYEKGLVWERIRERLG